MTQKIKVGDTWFNLKDQKTVYVITKIHKANFSITNASCKIYKKVANGNWFNTKEDDLVVFSIDYKNWRKLDF